MSKNKTSGLLRLFVVMAVLFTVSVQAQFATMNKILDRTAERRQANKDLSKITLDGKKFLLIRDFPDHTERNFISVNGDQLTFVEVFDDKQTGQSSSNVFSGDVVRTRHNMISLRQISLKVKELDSRSRRHCSWWFVTKLCTLRISIPEITGQKRALLNRNN